MGGFYWKTMIHITLFKFGIISHDFSPASRLSSFACEWQSCKQWATEGAWVKEMSLAVFAAVPMRACSRLHSFYLVF